jgi:Mg-chelatase subunit ChlI
MKKIEPFPLGAIVGLEQAKRSLIYHAIDPRLGGVLLVGHRGCAKTTMARGFAELLPGPLSHPGDAPFVEIPLGTTEDRLLGSVHAQALVESATWGVQTGLI